MRPEAVEKAYFERALDWDHDGRMNRTEIAAWFIPSVQLWHEFSRDESRHLIEEADGGRKVRMRVTCTSHTPPLKPVLNLTQLRLLFKIFPKCFTQYFFSKISLIPLQMAISLALSLELTL